MSTLQDKLAIVTGGGSGINLAFCKLLYASGCMILIADIALHPSCQSWLSTIESENAIGSRVKYLQTDVTAWSQLEKVFDAASREFGTTPDIVVPGAGVYEPSSNSFWADQDRDSYKVLDINLVHPIKTSRIAIRRWVEAKKKGTIIFISSIAAQQSSIVTPLYTVSKHGINAFIRGMGALEDLAGIRVVGVAPGTVGTPLFTDHPEASKFLDLNKDFLLAPEHVANAMFALLDKNKYKSGTVLEVCHETQWRVTSLHNDPGPQGPASFTSRKHEAIREIMQYLNVDQTDPSVTGMELKSD